MSNSFFISIALHIGLLIATLLVTPPLLEKLDEPITVELIEPVQAVPPRPQVAAPQIANASEQLAQPEQQQAVAAKAAAPETLAVAEVIQAPMKKAQVIKSKNFGRKIKRAPTPRGRSGAGNFRGYCIGS